MIRLRWLIVGVAALAAACAGDGKMSPAPRELRVPIDRDVRSLDPHLGSIDVVGHNVLRQLFEGLVDYDPRTLEPVPRLAREWTVSDDGREWRFELRSGVRFADTGCAAIDPSREVEAEDVRRSIERGLARHRGASAVGALPPFVGLDAFLNGDATRLEGLAAETPDRLLIRLERPDPMLVHYLALPSSFVVATDVIDECGAELPIGSGPFRLISWTPGSRLLLAARRDYWATDEQGRRLPLLDGLRFIVTTDGRRQYALREADLYYTYDELEPTDLGDDEQRFEVTWLNTIFIRFNFRSNHPFSRDVRLRRLLSLIPRREFEGRIHLPAGRLIPPGIPGRDPDVPLQRTDAGEAYRLLEATGIDPARLPPVRIGVPYTDEMTGFWLLRGLEKLGFRGKIVAVDRAELGRKVTEGAIDVFRDGWVADFPDAQNFLQLFYSGSTTNTGGFADAGYDDAFERLRRATTAAERSELAGRLERVLFRETPAIFIRHERQLQRVAPRVRNWKLNGTNPLNVHYYERIEIDR